MAFYLATTFAVTWLLWWACARVASPRWLFALGGPVFLVGVFAPGLVALAFTARRDGAAGARRLLSGIARWSVPARLYLFALGFMAATRLVAAVVHRFATGDWPPFGDTPVPLMFAAILVSTWVQAGEEFFIQGSGSDGQSFPLYLVHVTALSVAIGWLYWKSAGSLFVAMLMHASINNTAGLIPAALPSPVRSGRCRDRSWHGPRQGRRGSSRSCCCTRCMARDSRR